jgi:hypothetical protein
MKSSMVVETGRDFRLTSEDNFGILDSYGKYSFVCVCARAYVCVRACYMDLSKGRRT